MEKSLNHLTAPTQAGPVSFAHVERLPIDEPKANALTRPGASGTTSPPVDWDVLLADLSKGKTTLTFGAGATIFMQGQPADALYFLTEGKVQLGVSSREGKEAIVATLAAGEFFGEGCLAGQTLRKGTAVSAGNCTLIRVDRMTMARALHEEHGLGEVFIAHLLSRIVRYEADFVDQLFNSSEKRLARILLLLSHFSKDSTTERVVAGVNQEHLAQMVGTTRSRINFFMNKFRKGGFIDYGPDEGLVVHRGLLSVLRD